MSSLSKLELQIRLSKRRLAEAELLERKRQEQAKKLTTTEETPKLSASNEISPKVVSFHEEARTNISSPPMTTVNPASNSAVCGNVRPGVLTTTKRSRCWESPMSTSKKNVDTKLYVNDDDNVLAKPLQRSSQKHWLSLDDSSDDNSGPVKKPYETFLAPKPRRSLGDSSQEEASTQKALSPGRPPPSPAGDSDSDDSTLRARRLLRRQAPQLAQKSAMSPCPKQKQASLPHPTKPKENDSYDSVEESESDASACEDEPPVRNGTSATFKTLASNRNKGDSASSSEDEENVDRWEKRRPAVALNPIALQKQKDEQFRASLAMFPPQSAVKHNDELWDSDPETESKEEPRQDSSKKKRNKRKMSTCSGSKSMQRAGRAFEGFWDDNNVLNSRGHMLSECSEQQLTEKIHPDGLTNLVFVNMASTPLVLEHGEHSYEVPPSLTRYLAGFQREGIEFMFACLGQNMGCM